MKIQVGGLKISRIPICNNGTTVRFQCKLDVADKEFMTNYILIERGGFPLN